MKRKKKRSVPLVEKSELVNYFEKILLRLPYAERLEMAEVLETWAFRLRHAKSDAPKMPHPLRQDPFAFQRVRRN